MGLYDVHLPNCDEVRSLNGSLISEIAQLRSEYNRLRDENERLKQLLVSWMSTAPVTHNLAGQPISYVQDTRIALGLKPLEPLKLLER